MDTKTSLPPVDWPGTCSSSSLVHCIFPARGTACQAQRRLPVNTFVSHHTPSCWRKQVCSYKQTLIWTNWLPLLVMHCLTSLKVQILHYLQREQIANQSANLTGTRKPEQLFVLTERAHVSQLFQLLLNSQWCPVCKEITLAFLSLSHFPCIFFHDVKEHVRSAQSKPGPYFQFYSTVAIILNARLSWLSLSLQCLAANLIGVVFQCHLCMAVRTQSWS